MVIVKYFLSIIYRGGRDTPPPLELPEEELPDEDDDEDGGV
jgi:hypothetical protein